MLAWTFFETRYPTIEITEFNSKNKKEKGLKQISST